MSTQQLRDAIAEAITGTANNVNDVAWPGTSGISAPNLAAVADELKELISTRHR